MRLTPPPVFNAFVSMPIAPPRFEEGRAMLLAGLRRFHAFATAAETIPAQWRDLVPLWPLPGQVGTVAYGAICQASEEAGTMEYLAGAEVASFDALPPEAGRMRVPAQRYAVFTHEGHVSGLAEVWKHIWSEWLPTSGVRPANTPDFERYDERFDGMTASGVIEIWFPVERGGAPGATAGSGRMKRFYVATETEDGGVALHPMKEWFRLHPSALPDGFNPVGSTSHQFRGALRRAGWSVEESESEVRLFRPGHAPPPVEPGGGGDEDDGREENASQQAFALEYQLRDFLADNLDRMVIAGRSVRLYVDLAGRDGIEYPTGVGPIDILGVDDTGAFVVFELKRARSADRAMGQLTRYMGWVKHTIGRDREVRGVIVARTIDTRLRYAAMIVPNVTLLEYEVKFELHDASGLPASS